MAPKGRKSISAWNLCEVCNVVLSQKDLATHAEISCPPSFTSWTHGFFKNEILYGIFEELTTQDGLKNIPKSEHDNLVLVSQSALQLCGICIGESVKVDMCGVSTVKKAWPTLEKSLVSVLMTRNAVELHWQNPLDGRVKVSKLKNQPQPAAEITVVLVEQLSRPIRELPALLQGKHKSRILKTGDNLCLQDYGRRLLFTITKILPFTANFVGADPLANEIEKLSLQSGDCKDETYYRVVEETRWNVETGKAENKDKSVQDNRHHRLLSIGGLEKVIEEVNEIIILALKNTTLVPGLPIARGILLYGVSGTGKTMLAESLAEKSGANIIRVCGAEIYSKFLGETETRLRELFRNAKQTQPCIVLLDEVDALCPKRGSDGSGGSEQDKRVVATLLTLLDGLHHSSSGSDKAVVVIATTNKPDAIDPALRRPGRLDREIEITVPDPVARLDILRKHLEGTRHQITDQQLKDVAFSSHGFVGADLASLCSRASMHVAKRATTSDVTVTIEDLSWALTKVKPSAMREVLIEVPNVQWSDIGGQHDLKLKLRQAVEWPLKHPEAFLRLGITPPRGILMYGPPGCSKTMIAKALATESKLNFLSIKGPELFSKWVGESEKAVREVFRKARQVAPAIVFFDELDALGGERSSAGGSGGSNVQERVLAQLLTELDGVEPLGNVTVVGATNRPDRIDKALLRPGRLDRVVYVPLPDAETRREILELQLRKMPVASDVDINEVVHRTERYSGAEVLAVCHEAALKALEEDLQADKVSKNHFMKALQLITPRTPESLLKLYETYNQS